MNQKIKTQKAFIQIPILIAVIVSLIVVGGIGAGVVLYNQGKLTSLTASISEVFKRAEEPVIIDSEKEIDLQKSQAEEEIKKLKEIIENQQAQIDKLLSRSPEVKEVIKEVPIEKIVEKPVIKEVEVIKEVPVEKIVYKEVCSCPQTQPSPTDEFEIAKSKVEQNEIFPLITGYKDSKGSCRCSSGYNKISCNGCPYFAENRLKVGETIRMKVSAIPSKNSSVIKYKFEANNVEGRPIKDWSNENFAEYTVPDIAYSSVVFTVVIRNDYPRRRQINEYDDYIQIYYEVQP